jgi:hypothetical protein
VAAGTSLSPEQLFSISKGELTSMQSWLCELLLWDSSNRPEALRLLLSFPSLLNEDM